MAVSVSTSAASFAVVMSFVLATAFAIVVMSFVFAAAFAIAMSFSVASAFTAAAGSAATFATHSVDEVFDFLVGCFA